ncbi:pyrroline-5-carboxylate reductase [Elizabethkingia meningoseptica]|uniref:pyrroline-5-carboxylate reductase n=1 Tax=Elizabethkingia meningoseptica TaxID=238 RepID=UPI000332C471|nr:pyrroline-5-carboxylate reductase [Elizabethkingia meningoseptica]EOR29489.1 pyrroline-5-carboxylate reductase [Elizabethkingia meningoseptica ATCC 13253 = NBRC 12535]AQX47531.1 pyrroline-5-carboxylate reductase [Elizabethkingia meningoseptica]KUY24203.1 pyrroline-5-carboxylate reductase [Elizabethkingia meningoseptica]MVW91517.1 pyrroline-5-carboxylate reductase [Elizabethkingia meningoseptica]
MLMKIAVLGTGNLGLSIIKGILKSGEDYQIIATRRNTQSIAFLEEDGIQITSDNAHAITQSDIILVTLKPFNILEVLKEHKNYFTSDKIVVSMATGISIQQIHEALDNRDITVMRAMPNTASDVGESLTCLVYDGKENEKLDKVKKLLAHVGSVIQINEDLMEAATVLGACGIAYVLRFMRAMVQGGIQIGFDAKTAVKIVNQTVKGAAELLIQNQNHPEDEIDKVTTPKGCTIVGLNEMEHQGFSSSLIKGINASFHKIEKKA